MESDTHGQRWSARFLWKEGASTADIHRRLQGVCGDHAPGKRTVYDWVTAFKNGRQSPDDRPRSGRPPTAVTAVNIKRVKDAILENRRLSFTQMEAALGIGRCQLWTIVHKHLQLRKLCAQWVPKDLTPQQRLRRVEDCTALLNMYDADSEAFFRRLVTGDESWQHCYESETKEQSKQWMDAGSAPPVKCLATPSASKRMATVFWDTEGIILIDWLPSGATINGPRHVLTLRRLRRAIQQKRPGKWTSGVLLQHDNARPHTSAYTMSNIASLGFQSIPHPPYSPDVAPISGLPSLWRHEETSPSRETVCRPDSTAAGCQDGEAQRSATVVPGWSPEVSKTLGEMYRCQGGVCGEGCRII